MNSFAVGLAPQADGRRLGVSARWLGAAGARLRAGLTAAGRDDTLARLGPAELAARPGTQDAAPVRATGNPRQQWGDQLELSVVQENEQVMKLASQRRDRQMVSGAVGVVP